MVVGAGEEEEALMGEGRPWPVIRVGDSRSGLWVSGSGLMLCTRVVLCAIWTAF